MLGLHNTETASPSPPKDMSSATSVAEVAAASKRRRVLVVLATLAVFGASLAVLQRSLAATSWHAVRGSAAAIPWPRLLLASGSAAGSYFALTFYDVLALHALGLRLPYRKVAATSLTAYGIANTVGVSSLSGGAIRLRAYTGAGLAGVQVAALQLLCSWTFFLGAAAIASVELVAQAQPVGHALHIPPLWVRSVGLVILALWLGYLAATRWRREPLRFSGLSLVLPTPAQTGLQLLASVVDLTFAAATLYWLLPPHSVHFQALLPAYVLAMVVGALSNVPGALGVFESGLLLLLPQLDAHRLLAGMLVYRVIYSFVPFTCALALLVSREVAPLWRRLGGDAHALLRSLQRIAPKALAVAVFVDGAVLTFSGATPSIHTRVDLLHELVPLPLVELSHLLGSVFGFAMMVLARGIYRRVDGAYLFVQALMAASVVASLLKGLDYEESILLIAVMLLLHGARGSFKRRAALLELSWSWLLQVALVLGAGVWLGFLAYRHVEYSNELWWQFAFDAGASRMLRASLVGALLLLGTALWQLLRPTPPVIAKPRNEDLDRVSRALAHADDTMACLAWMGDKQLLLADNDDAFLMYAVSGHSLITLGDPVGPAAARSELAWRYRELCDRYGMLCVFYEVKAESLPLYLDLGLAPAKLGEEAHVMLEDFHLSGRERSGLRAAQRKVTQGELAFRVMETDEVLARMSELSAVSDAWLAHKPGAEKGFSVGRFAPDYIRRFPSAVVERGGRIVAFANILQAGTQELSIDLMRYADDAPHGLMDGLLVNLMLWGKERGFKRFNLGMAPLSGLSERPLSPLWHKAGLALHTYGQSYYNFEGLRRFKEKYHPVWLPRYLASPGGVALPRVLIDVTTLISGGLRSAVSK